MGHSISLEDPELDLDIKNDLVYVNIPKIIEVAGVLNDICPAETHLNQYDFEDIFSLCLKHPTKLFETLKETLDGETEEVVSIYEAITAMTFLCHDEYEKKMTYIFQIFDFDQNFTLTKTEFELTVTAGCRALTKLLKNVETPSNKEIQELANSIFLRSDKNMSNTVTVEELLEYFNSNYRLQNFLLIYTHSTSHENAIRRFNEKLEQAKNAYQTYLNTEKYKDTHCELSKTLANIFEISESYVNYQILLAKRNQESADIDKQLYDSICKAVASYKAIDTTNEEKIYECNYYLIIWLYDEEEPDDYKVKVGIDQLDTNRDECISLDEWIKYLCLHDNQTNTHNFKGKLRKIFVRHDSDHSGVLEKSEAVQAIYELVSNWVQEVTANKIEDKLVEKKDSIMLTIDGLLNRLFRKMRKNVITWENFGDFLLHSDKEIEELKRFLLNTLKKNPMIHLLAK